MKARLILLSAVAIMTSVVAAYAHHSFAATYDESKTVTITGKMVQFSFRNPHSFVQVEVDVWRYRRRHREPRTQSCGTSDSNAHGKAAGWLHMGRSPRTSCRLGGWYESENPARGDIDCGNFVLPCRVLGTRGRRPGPRGPRCGRPWRTAGRTASNTARRSDSGFDWILGIANH